MLNEDKNLMNITEKDIEIFNIIISLSHDDGLIANGFLLGLAAKAEHERCICEQAAVQTG